MVGEQRAEAFALLLNREKTATLGLSGVERYEGENKDHVGDGMGFYPLKALPVRNQSWHKVGSVTTSQLRVSQNVPDSSSGS